MGVFKAQNSFTAGVLSSALFGRVDLPQYLLGASVIKNFMVKPWGGITRRGGLYYDWEVKDSSVETRLLPFRYASGDAFVIEAGPEYFRFGKNGVLISGANGPAEIETPYTRISWASSGSLRALTSSGSATLMSPPGSCCGIRMPNGTCSL